MNLVCWYIISRPSVIYKVKVDSDTLKAMVTVGFQSSKIECPVHWFARKSLTAERFTARFTMHIQSLQFCLNLLGCF